MATTKRIFFRNLDGLRAIAALLVFISHIELLKTHFVIQLFRKWDMGFIGVTIFLVLSGFLITYLLMQEKEDNGDVNYKKFYLRRILRIWPLYFLVLLFGYYIFPQGMSLKGFLLSVFFLPGFAMQMNLLPMLIDPIWSVGVEEQFYLVQPHLMRITKPANIAKALLLLLFINYFLRFAIKHFFPYTPLTTFMEACLFTFRFDSLIIGSLTALLFFNEKHKLFNTRFSLAFFFSKPVQAICFLVLITFPPMRANFPHIFNNELLSVATAIAIINLCKAETCIISLDNKILNYTGKISYGLYLMHKLPAFFVLLFAEKYLASYNSFVFNIFVYFFSLLFSILLAGLSYKYYESYFLRIKSKYGDIVK